MQFQKAYRVDTMNKTCERVIVVTGSSSGIGHALACRLSSPSLSSASSSLTKDKKDVEVRIVATMRAPDQCARSSLNTLRESGCDVCALDVTDDASVDSALQYVDKKYGHCDAVVAAAGTGVAGNMETVSFEDARQVFDVNVWGVMRVARAFAPLLRRRRRHLHDQNHAGSNDAHADCAGVGNDIVNDHDVELEKHAVFLAVSSQSGVCGLPYNDVYVASKHALEGLLESWRYTANVRTDVGDYRYVHIAVVNPGATRTAYGERLVSRAAAGGHKHDGTRAWAEEVQRLISQGQDVDECAGVIEDVIEQAFRAGRCANGCNEMGCNDIPFRNATSAQGKRVIDSVLCDPAGMSGVYAERFALGHELDRRVRDGEVGDGCSDRG